MVHIGFNIHELSCTPRGAKYFPSLIRPVIIAKTRHNDLTYYGEYAPLSGIHSYTLADVMAEVPHVKLVDDFFTDPFNLKFCSPINYMISMIHLTHNFILSSDKELDTGVMISGLVDDQNIDASIKRTKNYLQQGIRCLKIKIGPHIEQEIDKILSIASILPAFCRIRIDANKKLSLNEAKLLLKYIRDLPIDYLEEPLANLVDNKELFYEHGIKVAIDESFAHPFKEEFFDKVRADFLVIKPSKFDSVYDAMMWAQIAKNRGIIPVLSTAFETEISTIISMMMIHALGIADIPHGIWVNDMFNESLCKNLPIIDGKIYIEHGCELLLNRAGK